MLVDLILERVDVRGDPVHLLNDRLMGFQYPQRPPNSFLQIVLLPGRIQADNALGDLLNA